MIQQPDILFEPGEIYHDVARKFSWSLISKSTHFFLPWPLAPVFASFHFFFHLNFFWKNFNRMTVILEQLFTILFLISIHFQHRTIYYFSLLILYKMHEQSMKEDSNQPFYLSLFFRNKRVNSMLLIISLWKIEQLIVSSLHRSIIISKYE